MRQTKHAVEQQQRRGIPDALLAMVMDHGVAIKATGRASMYRVSKKELPFLKNECPAPLWRRYRDSLNRTVPVVAEGDTVITARHRWKRIRKLR